MIPDQIEKNLLILLDPTARNNGAGWQFVEWRNRKDSSETLKEREASGGIIYRFSRRDLPGYLFSSRQIAAVGPGKGRRKFLYVNDGLLSSIFDARKIRAYKAFSDHHNPPRSLRQKLISLLPLFLRAERRYMVIENRISAGVEPAASPNGGPEDLDFMFFSNAPGKLGLTQAETFESGHGEIFKTTANADYLPVMEKEFAIMRSIGGLGKPSCLPATGRRIAGRDRAFFTEEYVSGTTLREIIHRLSVQNNVEGICGFLDRLDDWFTTYSSLFHGASRPVASVYGHVLSAFSQLYGADRRTLGVPGRVREILAVAALEKPDVETIIAHNDLWPGNFIVRAEGLVAIDWERAAPDRGPFFDYYWMIISAVLEYHVCRLGVTDYSRAFRIFVEHEDTVSRHGLNKLESFLSGQGIGERLHEDFLLMFLAEWSVQGYLALGRQTEMDGLAFGELLNFVENRLSGKMDLPVADYTVSEE